MQPAAFTLVFLMRQVGESEWLAAMRQPANGVGRHPPGNDGTFVAGHIITVFRFQIPVFGFLQAGVTGGIQQLGCSVYRVERRY